MTARAHRNHDVGPRSWFILGGLFGSTITACLAVGLMALNPQDGFVGLLKEWQTLFGGLLALGGAVITVVWIQRQIDHARAQEEERRERKHYAARATMPAALSDVYNYAEAGLAALKLLPQPAAGRVLIKRPDSWIAPALPRVPSEAIGTLRICIETAEPGPRREIAKLLADLQIYSSRLRDAVEFLSTNTSTSVSINNVHHLLADNLEFLLRCDRMFRFARGEEDDIVIHITLNDMGRRAIFADLESYPGFTEMLVRRYGPETKVE